MELPRQQVQFFCLARRLLNFGSCQLQLVGIACFSAQLSVATPRKSPTLRLNYANCRCSRAMTLKRQHGNCLSRWLVSAAAFAAPPLWPLQMPPPTPPLWKCCSCLMCVAVVAVAVVVWQWIRRLPSDHLWLHSEKSEVTVQQNGKLMPTNYSRIWVFDFKFWSENPFSKMIIIYLKNVR